MECFLSLLPQEMIQEISKSLSYTESGLFRSTCKYIRNSILPNSFYCSELITWCIHMFRDCYTFFYNRKVFQNTPWGEVKIVWTGMRPFSSQPSWNIVEALLVFHNGYITIVLILIFENLKHKSYFTSCRKCLYDAKFLLFI